MEEELVTGAGDIVAASMGTTRDRTGQADLSPQSVEQEVRRAVISPVLRRRFLEPGVEHALAQRGCDRLSSDRQGPAGEWAFDRLVLPTTGRIICA